MSEKGFGDDFLYLGDGEWISWDDFGEEDLEDPSELARLEREANWKLRFPDGDVAQVPYFMRSLALARDYHEGTGRHLQIYGDIGELFGSVAYGVQLNKNYAQRSDGRLGSAHVEIKTITPFKRQDRVTVKTAGNFSKLLVVKIDNTFAVSGRMIDRSDIPKVKGPKLMLDWDQLQASDVSLRS